MTALHAQVNIFTGDVLAVSPISGGSQNHEYFYDGTMGWTFDVSTPLTITALGFFDATGDGLSQSHQVAIWRSPGIMVVSATVPAGTMGTLVDGFRFVAINPITLTIPGGYTIGAYVQQTCTDDAWFSVPNYSTVTGLAFGVPAASSPSSILTLPPGIGSHSDGAGYLGPNFLVSSVPEPAAISLLAIAFGAMCLIRTQLQIRRNG